MFHDQTLAPLINNYVRTGKVYLVQHEFPLPIHPHSREAACLACAADKIGRYQQVCDQLFRTQDSWHKDGKVAEAACAGMPAADASKLRSLAGAQEITSLVDGDIRAGQAEKVSGTPTLIITRMLRRYPVSGPVSYEVLSKFLDSLLN